MADLHIVLHVGIAVRDDLALEAVVPVGVVGDVVIHGEFILTNHQRGQFEILRIHHSTRAPTGPVVNPRTALRVQRVIRAFTHDFPAPLGVAVDLYRVRVVAEFRAVVSRAKAVPTCPGFQSEHGFTF